MGILSDWLNKIDELVNDKPPSADAIAAMEQVLDTRDDRLDFKGGAKIAQVTKGFEASVGVVRANEENGKPISLRVQEELADLNLDLLKEAGMTDLANDAVESLQVASANIETNERSV